MADKGRKRKSYLDGKWIQLYTMTKDHARRLNKKQMFSLDKNQSVK